MLQLKNITIKNDKQLYLQDCNCIISSQTVIILKNHINSKIIAQTLAGMKPVSNGEIYLQEEYVNTNSKSNNKRFFIITEDYAKLWENYSIIEISKIISKKYHKFYLLAKYKISPTDSINLLTSFQKLIILISLGKYLKRSIFILDNPTKNFDYEDLDNFFNFLREDFRDENFIIFSKQFDYRFINISKSIYQIGPNKSLILRGGENNDN